MFESFYIKNRISINIILYKGFWNSKVNWSDNSASDFTGHINLIYNLKSEPKRMRVDSELGHNMVSTIDRISWFVGFASKQMCEWVECNQLKIKNFVWYSESFMLHCIEWYALWPRFNVFSAPDFSMMGNSVLISRSQNQERVIIKLCGPMPATIMFQATPWVMSIHFILIKWLTCPNCPRRLVDVGSFCSHHTHK